MATTPTNNPVPSESPRDLKFNAGKFDQIISSTSPTYVDRLGKTRYTHAGLEAQLKSATGAMAFANEALLKSFTPPQANVLAQDTATGTFWYWNGSTWNKNTYQFNERFSQRLLTSDLDSISTPGLYVQDRAVDATNERHYPVSRGGTLIVTYVASTNYTSQVYFTIEESFFRQFSAGGWSAWSPTNKVSNASLEISNLNDIELTGIYSQRNADRATPERNYPVSNGGTLVVSYSTSQSYVSQTYLSTGGAFIRQRVQGVWSAWVPMSDDGNDFITDRLLTKNLNDVVEAGIFVQDSGGNATPSRNYPVSRGGTLIVAQNKDSGVFYASQTYITIDGLYVRQRVSMNWGGWVSYAKSSDVKSAIADALKSSGSLRMVVHGSSTLNYMAPELLKLAAKYSMSFKNGAVGGYWTAATAVLTGQNKVTLSFIDGVIPRNSPIKVNVNFSWGAQGGSPLQVTLSNGVVGILKSTSQGYEFTASNLTEGISDVKDIIFSATPSEWIGEIKGTYIMSIGKNNVSSTDNNYESILSRIEEIISGLPKDSPFMLCGFFSDYQETSFHINNVEKINSTLKSKYGLKFVDLNKYILSEQPWIDLGLQKTAEDISAISARTLPPSLSRNRSHVSPEMDKMLTNLVEASLLALGYVTA